MKVPQEIIELIDLEIKGNIKSHSVDLSSLPRESIVLFYDGNAYPIYNYECIVKPRFRYTASENNFEFELRDAPKDFLDLLKNSIFATSIPQWKIGKLSNSGKIILSVIHHKVLVTQIDCEPKGTGFHYKIKGSADFIETTNYE